MAIESIHRIINTKDRSVLDMEYRNIIHNLDISNIEADNEIIELYQEVMNFISGKILAQEDSARLQKNYDNWEKQRIINSLYEIRLPQVPEGDIITIGTTLAVSCISQYLAYQNETEGPLNDLDEAIRKLDVEEQKNYNSLQTRLLHSSWGLVRKYKMTNEYRIEQNEVEHLFQAINEPDNSMSLRMLRALEDEFRIYPPYWIYRARSAEKSGNIQEVSKCYDEFDKVWRPVLKFDPYKLEVEKFRVQEAMKAGKNSQALEHIALVYENTRPSDWANTLFAGVAYFVLGDRQKGMQCVNRNVIFDTEKTISDVVLEQMKAGKLNLATLPEEIRKLVGLSALRIDIIEVLAMSGDIEAQLMLGKIYSDGGITFSLEKIYAAGEISLKNYENALSLYEMAARENPGKKLKVDKVSIEILSNDKGAIFMFDGKKITAGGIAPKDFSEAAKWYAMAANQNDETAILSLAGLYAQGGPNLARDYKIAAEWFKKLADKGNKTAQNSLAKVYFDDKNYYDAYVWCCVAGMTEEHFIDVADTALVAGAIIGGIGAAIIGAVIGAHLLPFVAIGAIIGAMISTPLLPFIASDELIGRVGEYTIKEKIEGAGIFNTAKLSSSEMDKAKIEAGKIIAEIEQRIKQRQQ